ncbi:MAG: SCO family protein [Thermoleophilia bacterium]|nr:SCO family protein [Thermoleophilia bacterium]
MIARLGIAALAAAAALGVALLLMRGGEEGFRGSPPPEGIELPAFRLGDAAGKTVLDSRDLEGKVVLVTFLDTKCTEACPIIGEQLRQGLARLDEEEREETLAIAISVHPGDDTPATVQQFLRRHRLEGTLRYLSGSEAALRPVWRDFQVLPALDTGSSDLHSAPVRVYDRDGVWVSTLHAGADLTPENLAHDVRAAG